MDVNNLLIDRRVERMEGWLLDLAADNEELRQRFRENRLDVYGHMNALGRDMDRIIDKVNEVADKTKKGFKRAREELDSHSDTHHNVWIFIRELEETAESLGKRIKELEANCNDRMEKLSEDLHDKYTGRVEWWQKCAKKLEEKEDEIHDEVRFKMEATFALLEAEIAAQKERINLLEGKKKKARTTE